MHTHLAGHTRTTSHTHILNRVRSDRRSLRALSYSWLEPWTDTWLSWSHSLSNILQGLGQFHVAHFLGCATLFNKDSFEPDLLVKSIYVPGTTSYCKELGLSDKDQTSHYETRIHFSHVSTPRFEHQVSCPSVRSLPLCQKGSLIVRFRCVRRFLLLLVV